jgi:hypothetical protein
MSAPCPTRPWRRGRPVLAFVILLALTLPDCGGDSRPTAPPQPTPTPPPVTLAPTPTTLADLSASVTSPQADASINCSGNVDVRLSLENRGGTAVAISEVRGNVGIPAGRCFGGGDFSLFPRTDIAFPNTTTVVLNRPLFPNGPGCCDGRDCGSSCRFLVSFEVVTQLGNVPAGSITYTLFFQNCRSCTPSVTAAGEASCGRPIADSLGR